MTILLKKNSVYLIVSVEILTMSGKYRILIKDYKYEMI